MGRFGLDEGRAAAVIEAFGEICGGKVESFSGFGAAV
jgi:hypothetical protein